MALQQLINAKSFPPHLLGVVIFLVAAYGLHALYGILTAQKPVQYIPLIGGDGGLEKSKRRFIQNSREVIRSALRQAQGTVCQIYTDGGPKVLLRPEHIEEIKNDPNFSFEEFIKDEVMTNTTGFKQFNLAPDTLEIFKSVVRVNLTQALSRLTVPLSEETALAMDKFLPPSKEWKQTIPVAGLAVGLVSQLSARAFLGLPICRDPTWLLISGTYARDMMVARQAVRRYAPFLRAAVFPLLPQTKALKRTHRIAYQIIDTELHRRRQRGYTVEKEIDALRWFEEAAEAAGHTSLDIVNGQLGLTMAAVHTTSNALSNALMDLAVRPKLVDELRKEIVEVLGTPQPPSECDGNDGAKKPVASWQKTSLYRLRLLDSFLKESQRFNPGNVMSLRRLAIRPTTLSDGTHIPARAAVFVPTAYMQEHLRSPPFVSPSSFSPPESFDPYRYLRLRDHPGEENRWQFATASSEHFGFGVGLHSCPGRFFASNELKIALIHALVRYDWRCVDGARERPRNILRVDQVIPDPDARLEYRAREAEIVL
ncbi:cytochrome P450 [Macrophomina phaseolina]|uniref:Cytochrome P450 n=1 Tax=Macrophomina phaseolina TaxID=35725 RepID=A0ABQ8GW48_9PEZI|nr:cytochrome P450 [Macrophomina phaseolina]